MKEDIREGDDDTLFYKQRITYVFNDELSGTDKYGRKLKVDTKLNILNIPFIVSALAFQILSTGFPTSHVRSTQVLNRVKLFSFFFSPRRR